MEDENVGEGDIELSSTPREKTVSSLAVSKLSSNEGDVYLPNEIMFLVFSFMGLETLFLVAQTNRRFQEIARVKELWLPLTQTLYSEYINKKQIEYNGIEKYRKYPIYVEKYGKRSTCALFYVLAPIVFITASVASVVIATVSISYYPHWFMYLISFCLQLFVSLPLSCFFVFLFIYQNYLALIVSSKHSFMTSITMSRRHQEMMPDVLKGDSRRAIETRENLKSYISKNSQGGYIRCNWTIPSIIVILGFQGFFIFLTCVFLLGIIPNFIISLYFIPVYIHFFFFVGVMITLLVVMNVVKKKENFYHSLADDDPAKIREFWNENLGNFREGADCGVLFGTPIVPFLFFANLQIFIFCLMYDLSFLNSWGIFLAFFPTYFYISSIIVSMILYFVALIFSLLCSPVWEKLLDAVEKVIPFRESSFSFIFAGSLYLAPVVLIIFCPLFVFVFLFAFFRFYTIPMFFAFIPLILCGIIWVVALPIVAGIIVKTTLWESKVRESKHNSQDV